MNSDVDQFDPAARSLRAGPLSAELDPHTGAIRNVCFEGERVWTELVVLVRDDQWQVVRAEVALETAQLDEHEFSITLRCLHRSPKVHFFWRGRIQGTSAGTITYEFSGAAETGFMANRIGFSLLHPSFSCAGQPIRQTRTDGQVVPGCFPQLIEPQVVGKYSIRDLRELAYQLPGGTWAKAAFEGDVFETEDQRNWMDASFKTYCTPLEQPFPAEFKRGDQRSQKVVLSAGGRSDSSRLSSHPDRNVMEVHHRRGVCRVWLPESEETNHTPKPAPQLGLTLNDRLPLTDGLRAQLTRLGLSSLRTDLFISHAAWQPRLRDALAEARDLGVKLEVALQLPHSTIANLGEISRALDRMEVCRVLVYRRGHPVTETAIAKELRAQLNSSIQIGGGSDANFCELNREHALGSFNPTDLDVVAWSINPQVHARDNQSVMETVHSLPAMASTAKRIAGSKPMVISPITLRPRFNAVARDAPSDDGFPDPLLDERQHESMVATWMVAAWIKMAAAEVTATSWFETHGPCGLFGSDAGRSNPVADAFEGIMAKARSVVPCQTDTFDAVVAIVDYESHQRFVAANLVDSKLKLTLGCEGVAPTTLPLAPYATLSQPIRLPSPKRDQHEMR